MYPHFVFIRDDTRTDPETTASDGRVCYSSQEEGTPHTHTMQGRLGKAQGWSGGRMSERNAWVTAFLTIMGGSWDGACRLLGRKLGCVVEWFAT